jgi:queuine/archaeosine tRNA-ribosyltransferase
MMRQADGGIMGITFGAKQLVLPVLIPSISSFETVISPGNALALQSLLSEPVTLVSAFDVDHIAGLREQIAEFRQDGKIVLLDSGGYESSRISRYIPEGQTGAEARLLWSFEQFKHVVQSCETDLVASFDYFLQEDDPSQSYSDFEIELLSNLQDHTSFINAENLVPVIHLQNKAGTYFFDHSETRDICSRIASEFGPRFIAVPERELGAGIGERVAKVKEIVAALKNTETRLHILGCGNPLTFALLAKAGAAMGDGLEWCRTLIGPDYKLHHFQQADLFEEHEYKLPNAGADYLRQNLSDYTAGTLVRNLRGLQQFNSDLAEAIDSGHLRAFIEQHFGKRAASFSL